MSSTSLTLAGSRYRLGSKLPGRAWAFGPLPVAVLTAVLAWAALLATHSTARPPVAKVTALHQVFASSSVGSVVRGTHWQRASITPVDSRHELVGFFRGSRMVALVTLGVTRHGVSLEVSDLTRAKYAYGSNIANDGWLLAAMTVVFVLMTAVWPLWRIRNLDVLACASLVLSVVLLNRWLLGPLVLASYPALLYLAFRCAWWGLGGREPRAKEAPLFEHLTRRWPEMQRLRTLRLLTAGAVLVVLMVGLTSPNILDVGYAVMEGATAIVHGVIPYGHVADIVHGDTYPLGSYLLYAPLAWLSPVRTTWDNADLTLFVAVAASLAGAWGLWRMASRRLAAAGRRPSVADRTSALRAVIAWLTFPPLLVTVSTGTTDVALAAMLIGGLVLWRRPAWSAAVLTGAAWFKLTPITVIPLLLARLRGRELGRGVTAISVVTTIMVGALLALGGWAALGAMVRALGYQFSRSSPHTLWTIVGSVPLQQLTQAATIGLIVGSAVRIHRDPKLGEDTRRSAAIAGAILLGVQISANYWNYMYLVWVFPFIAVSLLADSAWKNGAGGAQRPVPSGRLN